MSNNSVFRRKNVYYFRIKVPLDIIQYFDRKELWKSLKTSHLATAKSASKSLAYNIEQIFIWVRSGMLTESQIKQLVKEHLTNTLNGREFIRTRGVLTTLPKGTETIPPDSEWRDTAISTFQNIINQTKLQLFDNDFISVKSHVNQALERNGIAYDENLPEYSKLCREYLKAEIAISKIELERLDGNYDNSFDGFTSSLFETKNTTPISSTENAPGMKLSELITEHIKEAQQAESWAEKTVAENDSIYKVFLEILGDIDVSTITHKHLIGFRDKLVKMPANRGKDAQLRGKSIAQIMELKNIRPMSVSTVNKYLIRISSLFKWAAKHSYIASNYAEGLTLPKSRRADQEREAYSDSDIKKLLTNLKLDPQKPERYWIPLIAMYQGMRLEEICQLHLADIMEQDGITCISISEGGDKKVKTLSSRRIIPLHPRLISLGLLDYVNELRKNNKIRMWENLTRGRDGYSHVFGKWYQRFNREYITENPKLVFHSFRHNLANTLKQKGVQEITIAEIVGHATDSMTMSRYGKRYQPKVLLEALKLIDYHTEPAEKVESQNTSPAATVIHSTHQ